jgi:uncharacterized cupredoxin-like copper-binding protein
MRIKYLAAAAALGLALVACGDDDDAGDASTTEAVTDAPADTGATATTAAGAATTAGGSDSTASSDHVTVAVQGVDYAFEDLPAEVAAGTELTFSNASEVEFHEMVVIRIPDDEERPVEELLQLPEEEIDAIFGDGPPALVSVAGPGEDGMPVVGDGTITEPGRYVVACFIPVGADPAAVADAMQSTGTEQPDLGDGPPHFTQGMWAELTVTA